MPLLVKRRAAEPISRARFLLVLVCVLVSCFIAVGVSVAEVFRSTDPFRASATWPKNGYTFTAVADFRLDEVITAQAELTKSGGAQIEIAKWQGIEDAALKAFRLDPLNASALRSLAIVAEAKGNAAQATTLMAHALKFSRRDTTANNWQLRQSLEAENLSKSMRLLDRILREDASLRPQYLPVLIAGASQPEGFAAIYPLLMKQPAWEADFWSMSANLANVPPELAKLRQQLLQKRGQTTPMMPFLVTDVHLIRNLIRNDQFDAAKALQNFLAGNPERAAKPDTGIAVDDAPTGFETYDSAFDWQLTSQGDVQSYLDDSGSGIILEASSNSIGVFARHLVKSDGGRFRMKITAQPVRGVELFARLKCAETAVKAQTFDLQMVADVWASDQVIASSCRWFTLELLAQNKSADAAMLNITSVKATSIN
jgi:hypothetical protein